MKELDAGWAWRAVVAATLVLAIAGCGGQRAPERSEGSALWVSDASRPLAAAELRALSRGGVRELFVEVGELTWDGSRPALGAFPWYEPPERVLATLVVRGSWPAREIDGADVAESLAPAIRPLLAQAPSHKLELSGVHLHLDLPREEAAHEALADALGKLRKEIGGRLAWSATLDVEAPGAERVARAADFFVVFAYGRPPAAADDARSWQLTESERRTRLATALDRPFLLGVVTLGWARVNDGEALTRTDLTQLAWDRRLEAGHGFTLEGADRLTYRFVSQGRTYVGGQELRRGDAVAVHTTSSAHVAALLEALEGELGEGYRGVLFHRLGGLGEGLSLGPRALLHGLARQEVPPGVEVRILGGRRGGNRWVIEAVVRETAGEPTDLGVVDTNWVEVALPPGAHLGQVEPGNFYRYELLRRRADGSLERSLRRPEVVRFYAPFLPAHGELRSGPIQVVHRGDGLPTTVTASFLAPYGREVVVGPEEIEPVPAAAMPQQGEDGEGEEEQEGQG